MSEELNKMPGGTPPPPAAEPIPPAANVAPEPKIPGPETPPPGETPPVVETPPEPTKLEQDFSNLAKEFEADDVVEATLEGVEQEKGAKEEPPKPKAEEVPPKVDKPPQPKVEEIPPKVSEPPKEPVQPAAGEEPPKPVVEEPKKPEEQAKIVPEEKPVEVSPERVAKDRTDLTNHWTKQYEMSPEEGIEFLDAPHEVVPGVMARLHVGVLEDAVRAIGQLLPQIVARELGTIKTQASHEEAFYAKWPKLDKPEYKTVIRRVGDLYKQNNPDAPVEQFIQEVGATAMIAFKIPPDDMPVGAFAGAVLTPSELPPRTQHSPAQPGGGTPPPAPAKPMNDFELLSVEFEKEDQGLG